MKNYTKYIKSSRVTQKATALKYNSQTDSAPVVKAKGMGIIADRIIEIAKENNVPTREDPDLVELLMQIDVDKEIPPELYKVVAEILAFVYRLNNLKSET
ncbi:MAG: flagellar biosynthesis protein [Candidatus Poribacteria bacterium]|nr:flagellar biosynthesis protein [Candidatus Poribacteria bacterium]